MTRRYPLDQLFEAMGLDAPAACRRLRLSGSVMVKYRSEGVTELVADRLATRAGLATYTVWPEMLDDVIEDVALADVVERVTALELEQVRAITRPLRSRLRRNAAARRRYAENAAYREQVRAQVKAYDQANTRARKIRRIQWYRENRDRILADQKVRDQRRAQRNAEARATGAKHETEGAA